MGATLGGREYQILFHDERMGHQVTLTSDSHVMPMFLNILQA